MLSVPVGLKVGVGASVLRMVLPAAFVVVKVDVGLAVVFGGGAAPVVKLQYRAKSPASVVLR